MPKLATRPAAVSRMFALRLAGMSCRQAALSAGIPEDSAGHYSCRTEGEIRADLARQLESIVHKFNASVAS